MKEFNTSKKGNKKILHVGDCHFGNVFVDFKQINSKTGMYKMIEDQIEAFTKVVDIAIEQDVAVVLLPGDLYDRVSNISEGIQYAIQEQLLRLKKADIVAIIIPGNHDKPRSHDYKALVSRFDGIGEFINVGVVYKNGYEAVKINDEIIIHCLPYMNKKSEFKEEFDKIKPVENHLNVLMTHAAVQGANIKEYKHTEGWLNKAELMSGFDYIALGDYHAPFKVSEIAYYAGALVKNNFGERDYENSVILYNGATNSKEFIDYPVRQMVQYNLKCSKLDSKDINNELQNIIDTFSKEDFIKIVFSQITKEKQKKLDVEKIYTIKKEAFYCKIEYDILKDETGEIATTEVLSIPNEVFDTINSYEENILSKEKKQELKDLYEKIAVAE